MLGARAIIRAAALSCGTVYDKEYYMEVLLNSFHLNGHAVGFHDPLTYKLVPPCIA